MLCKITELEKGRSGTVLGYTNVTSPMSPSRMTPGQGYGSCPKLLGKKKPVTALRA